MYVQGGVRGSASNCQVLIRKSGGGRAFWVIFGFSARQACMNPNPLDASSVPCKQNDEQTNCRKKKTIVCEGGRGGEEGVYTF